MSWVFFKIFLFHMEETSNLDERLSKLEKELTTVQNNVDVVGTQNYYRNKELLIFAKTTDFDIKVNTFDLMKETPNVEGIAESIDDLNIEERVEKIEQL